MKSLMYNFVKDILIKVVYLSKNKVKEKKYFSEFEVLRKNLKKVIYEQNESIDEIIEALTRIHFTPSQSMPRAVFTFVGPVYSGKTYLIEYLTKFSNEYKVYKSFDMGQYTSMEDAMDLYGIAIDGDTVHRGILLDFIISNPESIIIFDDIDKADNQIQLSLLNLITNTRQTEIDFSRCIVIFTTSLGRSLYQNPEFVEFFKKDKTRAQALLIEAMLNEKKNLFENPVNAIPPKLLNFLAQNYIILFNKLGLKSITKIGLSSIQSISKHFTQKTGVEIDLENAEIISTLLTLSFSPYINPVIIKQKLPDILLDKITDFGRRNDNLPEKVIFSVSDEAIKPLKEKYNDFKTLLKELVKKNEYLLSKWEENYSNNVLTLNITGFIFKKLPSPNSFNQEKIPVIQTYDFGFKDIAGQKKVKQELKQIIRILKNPKLIEKFKIYMPKGMLLYGPQGVGKAMLAKAFTKEANLPFIRVSGSELFDPFYLKSVYEKAREYSPCIVILEQIDVKGILDGVITNMPSEPVLMELEQPFNGRSIFTIATVTKKEDVDPALISPGKIDLLVEVQELDKEARRFYINKLLKKPNDGKINVERVIHYISGMTGDELQRLGREASLSAIRNNQEFITEEILIEQINIIKYGHKLEGNKLKNFEEDLKRTAYHEAGHAVVSLILRPDIKIEQVTISPRSEALGFVSYNIEDYLNNVTKQEIFDNICVLLAGRLSKIKQFGENGMDSGAINDLEQATSQAYFAIANLGMDEELGFISIGGISENEKEFFREKIEVRLIDWIQRARKKTEQLIEENWGKIHYLAKELIEKEVVEGSELDAIMKLSNKK